MDIEDEDEESDTHQAKGTIFLLVVDVRFLFYFFGPPFTMERPPELECLSRANSDVGSQDVTSPMFVNRRRMYVCSLLYSDTLL